MTTWLQGTAMSQARTGHAAFTYNGWLYVLGGMTNRASNASVITSCERSQIQNDGTLGAWSSATALTAAKRDISCAVHSSGRVYIVGGANSGGTFQTVVQWATINNDGTLGSWNTTTAIPTAKVFPQVVIVGDYIYVMGGATSATASTNTIHRGTINSGTGEIPSWTALSNFPDTRYGAMALVNDGTIYVISGGTLSGGTVTLVETTYYATPDGSGAISGWTLGTPLRRGYQYAVGGIHDGRIYAHRTNCLQSAEIQDDASLGEWSSAYNIPYSDLAGLDIHSISIPGGMRDLVYNGRFYSTGGHLSNTAQTLVYYAEDIGDNTEADETTPTVTNVSPADDSEIDRHDPISFSVEDLVPGLRLVVIWFKYDGDTDYILVYDGDGFTDLFERDSTIEETLGDDSETVQLDFSLMPAGGWRKDIESIRIRAVDRAGNLDVEI